MTVGEKTLPAVVLLLLLLARGAWTAADDLCPMNASEPAPPEARLVDDHLHVPPATSYPPNAYRPAPDGNGGYVLCKCGGGGGGAKPCVRKCCAERTTAYVNKKCTRLNESLASSIHEFAVPKFVNGSGTVGSYETDIFNLVYGKLICHQGKYRLEPSNRKTNNFKVSEAGYLLNESGSVISPPGQFCLEQFSEFNYGIAAVVCSIPPEELNLPGEKERRLHMYYTAFAMTLSLPFLFSTFLVYALIRDLRNLHGKSLMCHVATLLVAYSSLILVQLMSENINDKLCVILAYIIQFSFLASFFWLNVMCFDLWWTFSGFRPLRGNLKENEAKKFIMYSIYAWGFTSLISISTLYMESLSNISSNIIRPEFGVNSCWFNTREAVLIYFYGPIGILLLSNLLMFIYTALMIAKHIRDAKNVLKGTESNVDHERQRFMLYLKLFIVMGVNWSAEIVSWALDPNGTGSVWYVTDIGNSLQGVLIFFIFVCKSRVLRLLNKKFCPQFSLFKTPTVLSTRTTTNISISRTSNNTKNNDNVEMNPNNVQNLTNNKLHDFKV